MLKKVYTAVWFLVGLAALAAYLAGFLNSMTTILFGMVFMGMVFMGIIAVLPASVKDYSPTK